VVAETSARLVLAAPGGPYTLTARADRIDIAPGGLVLTDYKTGTPPNKKQVLETVKPQLPLEAAMAESGLFAGVPKAPVAAMRYIAASGGEPAGLEQLIDPKDETVADVARRALAGLERLISRFDDPATPYEPRRRAQFSYDFDDYAQLARVAEWSADAGSAEGDAA
jgi:ATP-dependent helicase/nuclease subunit B